LTMTYAKLKDSCFNTCLTISCVLDKKINDLCMVCTF